MATRSDAAGLLDIYAPFVSGTSITFETIVPSVEAFADRISSYLATYPWLVCEIDGSLAGYAYASRYRERTAYQWSVECSVYIHPGFYQQRIATALYKSLISILQVQGFRNLYAVINLPNNRSVAFHESFGFRWLATYEKVGYKLGRWKDVGWWQLQLNEYTDEPAGPVSLSQLDGNKFHAIFEREAAAIG